MFERHKPSLAVLPLFMLAACAAHPPAIPTSAPTSVETTATYEALRELPGPRQPIPVAVYSYPDLTGQFKPSEAASTNSRAVTQGAVWMLVKSLQDAAAGGWFKVIQRANLDYLLKERQIIRETRGRVEQQTGKPQPGLPSLLFAGVILDGGIIGYDTNTVSGGLGARYLGIGGDVQYRQDTVTVYLNAISSQTGEILKSVMTRKTVASYGVRGGVFKFIAFQKLLEGEAGYTVNEPGQIALAQAIEHAVHALIIEGALEGLWSFEDEEAGKDAVQLYLADREDDLLLGDAGSAVAQALLNEEQLQQLAEARDARRGRLKAQAERREAKKTAALQPPAPQARTAPKAAPPVARVKVAEASPPPPPTMKAPPAIRTTPLTTKTATAMKAPSREPAAPPAEAPAAGKATAPGDASSLFRRTGAAPDETVAPAEAASAVEQDRRRDAPLAEVLAL